jgi:hypothetical protein
LNNIIKGELAQVNELVFVQILHPSNQKKWLGGGHGPLSPYKMIPKTF